MASITWELQDPGVMPTLFLQFLKSSIRIINLFDQKKLIFFYLKRIIITFLFIFFLNPSGKTSQSNPYRVKDNHKSIREFQVSSQPKIASNDDYRFSGFNSQNSCWNSSDPVRVILKETRIKSALKLIGAFCGANIAIGNKINGKMSLIMERELEFSQFFNLLLTMNTLSYVCENGIMRIENKSAENENRLKNTAALKRYKGKKIAIAFLNSDIRYVLQVLQEVSGKDFSIDKKVTGRVTLYLNKPVPWDQILDLVLDMNHLRQVSKGDGIQISKDKSFRTQHFNRKTRQLFKITKGRLYSDPRNDKIQFFHLKPWFYEDKKFDSGQYWLKTLKDGHFFDVDTGQYWLEALEDKKHLRWKWVVQSSSSIKHNIHSETIESNLEKILGRKFDPLFWSASNPGPKQSMKSGTNQGISPPKIKGLSKWPIDDIVKSVKTPLRRYKDYEDGWQKWRILSSEDLENP